MAMNPTPGDLNAAVIGNQPAALRTAGGVEVPENTIVTRVETVPVWQLALPDGTLVVPRSVPAPATAGAVVFEVPDTVTNAELRLGVAVTFDNKGTPGTAVGGPMAIPLALPA